MAKLSVTTRDVDPQMMAWDTEFWGIPVARATRLDGVSEWAADNTVGLVCLLVDTIAEAQEAEERGFRIMDVRVTLDLDLTTFASFVEPVVADPDEYEVIEGIASRSFTHSRFYADPRLDNKQCGELYRRWAREAIGRGEALVERAGSGTVLGFVTVGLDGGSASIELIAAVANNRREGVGHALVLQALRWAWKRGATNMRVVTQASNIPALRTFEGVGFRITNTQVWLHRWYDA